MKYIRSKANIILTRRSAVAFRRGQLRSTFGMLCESPMNGDDASRSPSPSSAMELLLSERRTVQDSNEDQLVIDRTDQMVFT